MSINVSRLIQSAPLQATSTILYTSPGATKTQIAQLTVTNTDTTAHNIFIYNTPTTSSPQPTDLILNKVLAPNETYVVYQLTNAVLPTTGSIWASADVANLVMMNASGKLIT